VNVFQRGSALLRDERDASMSFLDRIFGSERSTSRPQPAPYTGAGSEDEQALQRYRYMLKTAPPETVEQAHQEAFARLTPEQRAQVLQELARAAPANERASVEATSSDDPRAMARVATRAEVREPGLMERTLTGTGAGMGMAGNLLTSFAFGFVGSMAAQSFLSALGDFGGESAGDSGGADETTAENDTSGHEEGFGDEDGGDFEV
jgi:hypothetical protein